MTTSGAHADAFYREVVRTGKVWALKDGDGFPAPLNSDGERSMPFWSLASRAEAVRATVADFSGLDVELILLEDWRSRWLPGLERDGLLVGLNWSGPRATGYDVAPSHVLAGLWARE